MYIVLEIQKFDDSSVSTLVNSFINRNEAESNYHTVLAAAAISTVYQHSAIMMEDNGTPLRYESYTHTFLSESESETENPEK